MEFPIDAMARLCQTADFQALVMNIVRALLPQDSAPLQDMRHILLEWNCVDPRVLYSNAVEEPGVPVVLLPFVLQHALSPDQMDSEFWFLFRANDFLHKLFETLKELPDNATLDTVVPKPADHYLVKAANRFAIHYVRFTHPGLENMQAVLNRLFSDAEALSMENNANAERTRISRKIRAFFYGLTGHSLRAELFALP